MTMIGPAQPNQKCPECKGQGYQERGERTEYIGGKWASETVYADCDICSGSGRVTKATIEWHKEQQAN